MPILTMRAMECNKICSISKNLIDELEELLKCPRDYFNIEVVNSTYIKEGEIVKGYPIVDISWFDRGQELQDRVAEIVTKYIHSCGYTDVDIIFHVLSENSYYENGKHF